MYCERTAKMPQVGSDASRHEPNDSASLGATDPWLETRRYKMREEELETKAQNEENKTNMAQDIKEKCDGSAVASRRQQLLASRVSLRLRIWDEMQLSSSRLKPARQ